MPRLEFSDEGPTLGSRKTDHAKYCTRVDFRAPNSFSSCFGSKEFSEAIDQSHVSHVTNNTGDTVRTVKANSLCIDRSQRFRRLGQVSRTFLAQIQRYIRTQGRLFNGRRFQAVRQSQDLRVQSVITCFILSMSVCYRMLSNVCVQPVVDDMTEWPLSYHQRRINVSRFSTAAEECQDFKAQARIEKFSDYDKSGRRQMTPASLKSISSAPPTGSNAACLALKDVSWETMVTLLADVRSVHVRPPCMLTIVLVPQEIHCLTDQTLLRLIIKLGSTINILLSTSQESSFRVMFTGASLSSLTTHITIHILQSPHAVISIGFTYQNSNLQTQLKRFVSSLMPKSSA